VKRVRQWLVAVATADVRPFALLSSAAAWRLGGLAALIGAGLLAMGQIHPEPVAQRGGVAVIHPWAKGSALKGDPLPFYATFANSAARPDRLLKIETAAAHHAILKALDTKTGIVRPVELDELAVPANGRVSLRPGTHQITLIGLYAKVEPGSFIPVTFVFERAGRLSADIRVENLGEPEHKDHI
jgi:copper(I)-binding protein